MASVEESEWAEVSLPQPPSHKSEQALKPVSCCSSASKKSYERFRCRLVALDEAMEKIEEDIREIRLAVAVSNSTGSSSSDATATNIAMVPTPPPGKKPSPAASSPLRRKLRNPNTAAASSTVAGSGKSQNPFSSSTYSFSIAPRAYC